MRIAIAGLATCLLATPVYGQDVKTEARLRALEAQVQALQAELRGMKPRGSASLTTPVKPPVPAAARIQDPAEEAYMAAYHLWEQRDFDRAGKALERVAVQYPKHRRASYARNLAGRSYLESGKPATAAKILLANHELAPNGERTPDSLLHLSEALVRINKTPAACDVLDVLARTYRSSMRPQVSQRLPAARVRAKCGPEVTGTARRAVKL
jgi:TolA-binding protein